MDGKLETVGDVIERIKEIVPPDMRKLYFTGKAWQIVEAARESALSSLQDGADPAHYDSYGKIVQWYVGNAAEHIETLLDQGKKFAGPPEEFGVVDINAEETDQIRMVINKLVLLCLVLEAVRKGEETARRGRRYREHTND